MPDLSNEEVSKRFLSSFEKLPPRLLSALVFFALFLAAMHHGYWQYGIDPDNIAASFFDLDSESTVGSWFAAIQWFLIALFALCAYYLEGLFNYKKRLRIWWLIFALVFLVASLDDASILHETVGELLEPWFKERGLGESVFTYFRESPWLVFYAIPLGGFILASLVFLSERLKENRRALILTACGFAFFIIALVIEFVQGMPSDKLLPIALLFSSNCKSFYCGSVLIEETLENLGSACLVTAMLYYNIELLMKKDRVDG